MDPVLARDVEVTEKEILFYLLQHVEALKSRKEMGDEDRRASKIKNKSHLLPTSLCYSLKMKEILFVFLSLESAFLKCDAPISKGMMVNNSYKQKHIFGVPSNF